MTSHTIDKKFTSNITNQKGEGCCLAIVIADMLSIVLKITGEEGHDLVLSPQPLIEASINTYEDFEYYCKEVGLECVRGYPFTLLRKGNWDVGLYTNPDRFRHLIKGLERVQRRPEIKKRILENFGPEGPKLPILVSMYMGEFADCETARNAETSGKPYRPKRKQTRKRKKTQIEVFQHALLIVGCDTTDPKNHYCRVKSSYGKKWGTQGFSIVGFEAFEYIWVPSNDVDHGSTQNEWETPLDKEVDKKVLEKCMFVWNLSFFTKYEDIKNYFNNLKLEGEGVGQVEEVCFVSRNDIKFTRSAIVRMNSSEEVNKIINCGMEHIIGLKVNICLYEGMESHKHVYDIGKYRMTLDYPEYNEKSENELYEGLEKECHPYCKIELLKVDYKLTGKAKIYFQTEEDRENARQNLVGYTKNITLLDIKR